MRDLIPLSEAEATSEVVELLPAREALSTFNWTSHWASVSATNLSVALNAAALGSTAMSQANQTITVAQ